MSNTLVSILDAIGRILANSCKIAVFLAVLFFLVLQFIWLILLAAAPDMLDVTKTGFTSPIYYLLAARKVS